jgi:hypothetical protein
MGVAGSDSGVGRCSNEFKGMGTMAYAWAAGREALVYPDTTGFPILGQDGYRSMQLQTHYSNPFLYDNLYDSSGVRIWYTKQLQAHEVGVLQIGDPDVWLARSGPQNQPLKLMPGHSKYAFGCSGITDFFEVSTTLAQPMSSMDVLDAECGCPSWAEDGCGACVAHGAAQGSSTVCP